MKTLIITLQNETTLYPVVKVNGQRLKFKRNAQKFLEAKFQTDGREIELSLGTYHEAAQKRFGLYAWFFWLIGIFGIFAPRYEKQYQTVDFNAQFMLDYDASARFTFRPFAEGAPAFDLYGQGLPVNINNPTNRWYCDRIAEKRAKRYRRWSRLARLACIIGAVVAIALTAF